MNILRVEVKELIDKRENEMYYYTSFYADFTIKGKGCINMISDAEIYNQLFKIVDVQYAFSLVFRDKIVYDGYVDISSLPGAHEDKTGAWVFPELNDSKYSCLAIEVKKLRSELRNALFGNKIIEYWRKNISECTIWNKEMKLKEAVFLICWVYYLINKKSKSQHYYQIVDCWFHIYKNSVFFEDHREDMKLAVYSKTAIIYDELRVKPHMIKSVQELLRENKTLYGPGILRSNEVVFFRGHSLLNYILLPTIMRQSNQTGKYDFLNYEKSLYNEIQYKCQNDFEECETHLEKLTIMQHYGIPTRLLDITKNPLVALFFACISNSSKYGEVVVLKTEKDFIKWANSDTVSILSSLAAVSSNDIRELYLSLKRLNDEMKNKCSSMEEERYMEDFRNGKSYQRLLGEIRTEKASFLPDINPQDLKTKQFVYASMNNPRIINQSGAFVLFGGPEYIKRLVKYNKKTIEKEYIEPANELRYIYDSGIRPLIVVDNKQGILDELSKIGVNKERLFPEIEEVAKTILERCNNEINNNS